MPTRFTKKVVIMTLAVMLLLGGVVAQGASLESRALQRANDITTYVLTGAFDEVVAALSPEIAAQTNAEQLQMVWESLPMQVGELLQIGGAYVAETEPAIFVRTPMVFELATLDLLTAFDPQLQLVTFAFVPGEPPVAPVAPYADPATFTEETITFGVEGFPLSGTLTLPAGEGPFPVVVLVHGSGPHDRDETIGPNKPFRDIAWGLATQGIAVFRYDKRTFVHANRMAQGDLTVNEEVIDDAIEAARTMAQRDDIDRVFVLGHSLGGMMGPYIAQGTSDVDGLILMAANARPYSVLVIEQVDYLMSGHAAPGTEEVLEQMKVDAERLISQDFDGLEILMGTPIAYWIDIENRDQVATAQNLNVPILVLQGGRDYQVTMVDFNLWKEALGDKDNAAFRSYPNLNHLFIAGEGTSTPEEYMEQGFVAPEVIADIASWIFE